MRSCKYCNQEKSESEFRKNRRKCKSCERKDWRAYAKKNSKKRKAYREANTEKMHALQANWYKRKKEKVNEKNKKRYHQDLEFKKRKNIMRVIQMWKGGRANCKRKSKYLRCSQDFYMKWLQFNFHSGMTTETKGFSWHPDHVIPRNLFRLYDANGILKANNIRLCYSWYNVSPMMKVSNLSKHDKIDLEQLEHHVESLKCFALKTGEKVDQDYYELCATYLDAGNP